MNLNSELYLKCKYFYTKTPYFGANFSCKDEAQLSFQAVETFHSQKTYKTEQNKMKTHDRENHKWEGS